MWSVPLPLLLLPPLLLLQPLACAGEPCEELRAAFLSEFHKTNPTLEIKERTLSVGGAAHVVQVWGGGAAGRAAAAVQLAVVRALFGYEAQLRPERADLCSLLRADSEPAVLAAAATRSHDNCGADSTRSLYELASRAGPAAVPATPMLLAHAPDSRCAVLAASWAFYAQVGSDAGAVDRECNFSLSHGSPPRFTVLLRVADKEDEEVAHELRRRVAGMPVELQPYGTDQELRGRIDELRRGNEAFLFVDEYIWTDDASVVRVQPPACAPGAAPNTCDPALLVRDVVRVGNGLFISEHAPALANVAEMRLEPAEMRAVLRLERETRNLTAAGCRWALGNVRAILERLGVNINASATVYTVVVLPCADDPDLQALGAAARAARAELFNRTGADYKYSLRAVDCADEEALRAAVAAAAEVSGAVGLVAWATAEGYVAARTAAERAGLPLQVVGTAPAALALALRRLLRRCGWSRVFVLSDQSSYSRAVADVLLAGGELLGRRVSADSAAAVARALANVRASNARVVIVNAGWNVTTLVLCGAERQRLDIVWLVREARAWGVCGATRVLWPDAGTGAEGKPVTQVAALGEALARLTLGFDSFLHEEPSHSYDYRENSTYRLLLKYIEQTNVSDVISILTPEPAVHAVAWNESVCAAPDRATCATWRTGDDFAPHCLDAPVFASAAFLAVAALALLAAWRVRRARVARCERAWRRRLEAQRRRAASALVTYVVDRGAVRLLHEIGSGCYGRVHRAELRRPDGGTQLVAAKEPREGAAPAEESELLREACVLAPLEHAHVVRLVGVCLAAGPPLVLLEHARHLDLQRYLRRRRAPGSPALAPRALTRLAREAAGALQYLAGRRLVHRDVRAANCLVDARRSLKLADFGLARELGAAEPEYATTRRGLFPVLWMAPESLEQGVFSPASDVWALGVLLLEVATLGARPFGSWAPARVLRYVTSGGHPPLPPDLSPHTRDMVLACWRRAPERRPSAASVHAALAAVPDAVRPSVLTPLPPPSPPPLPPSLLPSLPPFT